MTACLSQLLHCPCDFLVNIILFNICLEKNCLAPGAQILKIVAPAISFPLSRLINHCIDIGTFSAVWQSAKVPPIYKGQGSRDDKDNYRPISVLPLLSKIFEKHIHQALYNFMGNNDFLYNLQSGFRRSHSTETALICLIDQLLSDMDKDHVVGLCLLTTKKPLTQLTMVSFYQSLRHMV